MGEGEGQKKSARDLSSAAISHTQRSKLRAAKFFVVVTTTEVLQSNFFGSFFSAVILLKA
jgi:hypothetical protein